MLSLLSCPLCPILRVWLVLVRRRPEDEAARAGVRCAFRSCLFMISFKVRACLSFVHPAVPSQHCEGWAPRQRPSLSYGFWPATLSKAEQKPFPGLPQHTAGCCMMLGCAAEPRLNGMRKILLKSTPTGNLAMAISEFYRIPFDSWFSLCNCIEFHGTPVASKDLHLQQQSMGRCRGLQGGTRSLFQFHTPKRRAQWMS